MKHEELYEKLSGVSLVAMDVDGTYTNGLLFYDSNGEVIKGFHSHDGLALELLRMAGIKRGFITGRSDNASKARAEYLKVDFFLDNIANKDEALKRVLADYGIPASESVFIGDDLNDLSAFEVAGISFAVANASNAVKNSVDFVTKTLGGSGAVREVTEMILEAKDIDPAALWKSSQNTVVAKQ